MQAIALSLALSLALGPAADGGEAPAETDAATEAAPDSEGDADASPAEDGEAPAEDGEPPAEEAEADASPAEDGEAANDAAEDAEPEAEAPGPKPEPAPEPKPEAPAPKAEPDASDAAPVVTHDRLGCDGSKPCRKMTIAGIVVGTLGLIGTGVGIGLLLVPDKVDEDQPIYIHSTHPPGLVTVTLGTGVLLTSVLMLVAAHRGYKQRGADLEGAAARVRLIPNGLRF